jgi:hypothetical protein
LRRYSSFLLASIISILSSSFASSYYCLRLTFP